MPVIETSAGARPRMARVQWYFCHESYGGVLPEQLVATVPLDDRRSCGLACSFADAGAPRARFLPYLEQDDLARLQLQPVSDAWVCLFWPDLALFLDRALQGVPDADHRDI